MSDSKRWWALAALLICVLTLGLDATILNVALPTLALDLGADTASLQWVVDAYVLVFAGLLLIMGALGDRIGRRRVLLAGMAFFVASSAAAAYVTSIEQLVVARAVMGLASAIMMPVALAILPVIFPPPERARAIGFTAVAMGLGVPLGPIVGGYLLDHFWWGSIFLVNVPVGVLGILAVLAFVPESRDSRSRPVDVVGGLTSTAGLTALVYGVIEAPRLGWGEGSVLAWISAGVVLLAGFAAWELRYRHPMIDLGLFRRPRFGWGTLAATVATFVLFGLLFTLPQYLQAVRGHDAFTTGLRLLPLMGGLVVGAAGVDRLVARIGARVPVALGLLVIAAGLLLGTGTSLDGGYGFVGGWMAVVGFGVGLALPPAMDAVLGELPEDEAGSGTALTMTLRQVGGALGIAVLGSLLADAYTARLDLTGLPEPAAAAARDSISAAMRIAAAVGDRALAASAQNAYLHAMSVVLLVCAVVAALSGVLVAAAMPARPGPAAARESQDDLARTA